VGTIVTIAGTSLTGIADVKINETSAQFQIVSSTSIKAKVPTGATSGPISVRTAGGQNGTSAGMFTVTVPPRLQFDYPVGTVDGLGWLNNQQGLGWLQPWTYGTTCGLVYHPGIDFNKDGTSGDQDRYEPVYAVADGKVVGSANYGVLWGNIILLEHTLEDGSKVWSQYAHLEARLVAMGASVTRRQQIGTVGKGDGRLPAHLHFEIRKIGPSSMEPSAFPCRQQPSYVTERYYEPIAFINSRRN
jgi:murein DD-endopeptidase MepM/ murein hydrolase activator NlpD